MQEKAMPEELLKEVNINWRCLDKKGERAQHKFIASRYNYYAVRQTLLTSQEDYFQAALRLRKEFKLDILVPQIAKAISCQQIITRGFVWERVSSKEFSAELALATNSAFRLVLREFNNSQGVFEIEMKLDGSLNKIPPTRANTLTHKMDDYVLV